MVKEANCFGWRGKASGEPEAVAVLDLMRILLRKRCVADAHIVARFLGRTAGQW